MCIIVCRIAKLLANGFLAFVITFARIGGGATGDSGVRALTGVYLHLDRRQMVQFFLFTS